MVNNNLRQYLNDTYESVKILDNPSFDNSIIGISHDGSLIYDMELMVSELAKDDNINLDEAYEFIDYNTLRALPYMGDNAPIIIDKFVRELWMETSYANSEFDRLGFRKIVNVEDEYIDFCTKRYYIRFNLKSRAVRISRYNDDYYDVGPEVINAIQYKLNELGWI